MNETAVRTAALEIMAREKAERDKAAERAAKRKADHEEFVRKVEVDCDRVRLKVGGLRDVLDRLDGLRSTLGMHDRDAGGVRPDCNGPGHAAAVESYVGQIDAAYNAAVTALGAAVAVLMYREKQLGEARKYDPTEE